MICSTRARPRHSVSPITVPGVALVGSGEKEEAPAPLPATRGAEVRPRVHGIRQKRLFVEGSLEEAGGPLYQIDPAPCRPWPDRTTANVETARREPRHRRIEATPMAPRHGVVRP